MYIIRAALNVQNNSYSYGYFGNQEEIKYEVELILQSVVIINKLLNSALVLYNFVRILFLPKQETTSAS